VLCEHVDYSSILLPRLKIARNGDALHIAANSSHQTGDPWRVHHSWAGLLCPAVGCFTCRQAVGTVIDGTKISPRMAKSMRRLLTLHRRPSLCFRRSPQFVFDGMTVTQSLAAKRSPPDQEIIACFYFPDSTPIAGFEPQQDRRLSPPHPE
jgi:hypothetical protein